MPSTVLAIRPPISCIGAGPTLTAALASLERDIDATQLMLEEAGEGLPPLQEDAALRPLVVVRLDIEGDITLGELGERLAAPVDDRRADLDAALAPAEERRSLVLCALGRDAVISGWGTSEAEAFTHALGRERAAWTEELAAGEVDPDSFARGWLGGAGPVFLRVTGDVSAHRLRAMFRIEASDVAEAVLAGAAPAPDVPGLGGVPARYAGLDAHGVAARVAEDVIELDEDGLRFVAFAVDGWRRSDEPNPSPLTEGVIAPDGSARLDRLQAASARHAGAVARWEETREAQVAAALARWPAPRDRAHRYEPVSVWLWHGPDYLAGVGLTPEEAWFDARDRTIADFSPADYDDLAEALARVLDGEGAHMALSMVHPEHPALGYLDDVDERVRAVVARAVAARTDAAWPAPAPAPQLADPLADYDRETTALRERLGALQARTGSLTVDEAMRLAALVDRIDSRERNRHLVAAQRTVRGAA